MPPTATSVAANSVARILYLMLKDMGAGTVPGNVAGPAALASVAAALRRTFLNVSLVCGRGAGLSPCPAQQGGMRSAFERRIDPVPVHSLEGVAAWDRWQASR